MALGEAVPAHWLRQEEQARADELAAAEGYRVVHFAEPPDDDEQFDIALSAELASTYVAYDTDDSGDDEAAGVPVSYTHLTLPTILLV